MKRNYIVDCILDQRNFIETLVERRLGGYVPAESIPFITESFKEFLRSVRQEATITTVRSMMDDWITRRAWDAAYVIPQGVPSGE